VAGGIVTERAFVSLIPPATAEVQCGDERHRLRWSEGELSTLDHEDPEGERTLAALGGTTNGCIDVFDAWNRHNEDLRVLTIASRGAADPLNFDRDDGGGGFIGLNQLGARQRGPTLKAARPSLQRTAFSSSMRRGWASYSGVARATVVGRVAGNAGPAPVDPGDDYITLFSLGGGLPERLAATVAWQWAERIQRAETSGSVQPALYAALASRMWLAVRAWTGDAVDVEVDMIRPHDESSAQLADGRWRLAVPFRWLSRVWAPGLALTAGRLVLDAQLDDRVVQLDTLARGTDRVARMTLDL
jgi:hypothetical protein